MKNENTKNLSKHRIEKEEVNSIDSHNKYTYFDTLDKLIDEYKDRPKIPFIWSGIKKGSFGFIFGPSKSGKTIFCENFAIAIANGDKSFFNIPIETNGEKILFISLEEPTQLRLERIEKIKKHKNKNKDYPIENLNLSNDDFPRNINTPGDWDLLVETIKVSQSSFVIIDSLGRLHNGKIEKSEVAKEIAVKLRKLASDLCITLVVIHHTPKLNGKPITLDSLAGSRVLAQEADYLLGINKTESGDRYFKEVACRYKPENIDTVETFNINESCCIANKKSVPEESLFRPSDGRRDDRNLELVLNAVNELTEQGKKNTTTQSLIHELVTSRILSKPTLFSHLNQLKKAGNIKKIDKGVYNLTTLTTLTKDKNENK